MFPDSPTSSSSRRKRKTSVYILCTDDQKQAALDMKEWLKKKGFDCSTLYCEGKCVDQLRETLQRVMSSDFVCLLCNEQLKKIFDKCPERESHNESSECILYYYFVGK